MLLPQPRRICVSNVVQGKLAVKNWINFGGNPGHHLDTGIVFRIRHYWEIRKVVNRHKCVARTDSRDGGTGKTCLGRGMHCPSAFSFCFEWWNTEVMVGAECSTMTFAHCTVCTDASPVTAKSECKKCDEGYALSEDNSSCISAYSPLLVAVNQNIHHLTSQRTI